jgi:hypothetical protein
MGEWWHRDVLDAGKLPLMLCLVAFVVTFLVTRVITRLIRAGRGPFKDHETTTGIHVHHAVPGLIVLIVGAFTGVAAVSPVWGAIAAVLVGAGVALVLDEFALILRLDDVYWSQEGRLSIDLVSLAAACLGLVLVGFSPIGVHDVGDAELAVRITGATVLGAHILAVVCCLLKGKYVLALLGAFLLPVAFFGAIRLARPDSRWATRRYRGAKMTRAQARARKFDGRYHPLRRRWRNLIAGKAS